MSDILTKKQKRLTEIVTEIEAIQTAAEADEASFTDEKKSRFTELLTEGEKIQTEIANQKSILGMKEFLNEPVKPAGGDGAYSKKFEGAKSLGAQFVASESYKSTIDGGKIRQNAHASVEAKATVTSATVGAETYINYDGNGGVPVMVENQRLTIRDLLAQAQTTMNAVPYLRETSYTNAATTVAESGLKPEATFALEDIIAPVKKIAVTAKVTDEMYADFPLMRDYLDNRMRFMVAEREEAQILLGDGTGSNLTGILATSGIQTQAIGTDTAADAIHKAITKVRVTGQFEPDGIVVHPNDWQELRLAKDANNQYYGGGPFTGAYGNPAMAGESFWGLRVVITTAITEGTALVGAFKLGAQVFQREGVTVESTNSNENDFVYNRMTIRVEERLALAVYRPLAFCKVTGI